MDLHFQPVLFKGQLYANLLGWKTEQKPLWMYEFLYLYVVFLKGRDVRTNKSKLIHTRLISRIDTVVSVTLLFVCLKCFLIHLKFLNLKMKSAEKASSLNAAVVNLLILACHISALSGILGQKKKEG